MKKKITIFIFLSILVIIVLIAGNLLFSKKKESSRETVKEENTQAVETNKPSEIKKYSLEEVAKHNIKEDCWMAINGKVYDVSPFIALGKHPPQILMGCGKEATRLFETRTTESGEKIGSGKPHSDNARKLLEQYFIGELE